MKFLIYAVGLAIVSLIIKGLRALEKKGLKKTSSILKFNLLLIIPAVLVSAFTMSRFYTSEYSDRFEKSIGDSEQTIITNTKSESQFEIPCEYSNVEFGKHFDVVAVYDYESKGDAITLYDPQGKQMDGILPYLFNNGLLVLWVIFITIEGIGNWLWIRKVSHK